MTDRHHRVKDLFLAARDVPVEERDAWLEDACGDDATVREDVEALLAAEDAMPTGYLDLSAGVGEYAGALLTKLAATPLSAMVGQRVGRYRVVREIGRGGMGEVWLAHDETLERRVALKVPAAALVEDPSARRRLRREARAAAALEHPAVCRVFELGQVDGQDFIVMEYLEGETLAERLARGSVPLGQALAWGTAIAGALEEAHDKGLVHRDLKPANVMVTRSGEVKVMDFGLARALPSQDDGEESAGTATVTAAGSMIGTPAYMAPEQLKGHPADARSDIWAFGCLLFETLTGKRAFDGRTATESAAAILEREPEWRWLPKETPSDIRRLLVRCLRKDPAQRLRHIGDGRLVLEEAVSGEPLPGPLPATPYVARRAWWRRRLSFASFLLLGLLVALAVRGWIRPSADNGSSPIRVTTMLPPGVTVTRALVASSVAPSPDGSTLVIAGTDADGQRLYWRPLDRLEATPLAGTEGGSSPFFSPDGTWIGFFADGRLRRVPAGGGAVADIAAAPGFPAGASWGPDDRIVFASGPRSALRVVHASGGAAEALTSLDRAAGEDSHRHPQILSDGRTLLFGSCCRAVQVHALDLATGRETTLAPGSTPRYTNTGHLLLSRGTTLLAAPFDRTRLELTGAVVPVMEDVASEINQTMHYGLSPSGTLAYILGSSGHHLVLIGEDGEERVLTEDWRSFERPRFSRDGQRVAVGARRGAEFDVWIYELEGGAATRLTFDGGNDPVWTPDDTAVTFSGRRTEGRFGIYAKSADGVGDTERLIAIEDAHHRPIGWTPDGQMLVYEFLGDDAVEASTWVFADGESRRVVRGGWGGTLSRDGRWLAYHSNESGRYEVYAIPLPEGGARWQISDDGGRHATWSPDGTEVFYRNGEQLIAARVDTTSGVRVVSRRVAVESFSPPLFDDYDVHPDGSTVVMVRPAGDVQGDAATLVLGWMIELQRMSK